ncbi:hypothetical protein TWF103_004758 [Orbilia oligospora]|nr:hypothetical protein TWF103_004758 [Orbilia oligospora]
MPRYKCPSFLCRNGTERVSSHILVVSSAGPPHGRKDVSPFAGLLSFLAIPREFWRTWSLDHWYPGTDCRFTNGSIPGLVEGFSGPWPSVKRGRSLAAGCKLLGSVLIGVQVDKRLDFMNMKPWILGLSPLHGPETRLRGNQFHKLGKYHEKIKSFGKGSLGMSDEDMQHTTPSPDNSTETSPTIRDGGNTMISVGPSSRGLGYDFWVQAEEMGSRARYLGIIEYESGGLGATNYNACSTSTKQSARFRT